MKIKKLLCLVLSLLFVLATAVGCIGNGGQNGGDDSEAESASESAAIPAFLDIAKDGVTAGVIYPKFAGADEIRTANTIASALKNMSGTDVRAKQESNDPDPDKIEIVIGATEYPETKQVMGEFGYASGVIRVVGNKVIILAYSSETYDTLATRFAIAMSNGRYDKKNVKIETSYQLNISDNALVDSIPVVDGVFPSYIKDGGDDSFVLMFDNASDATVDSYLTELTSCGYSEYASNTIDSNRYYTYTNSENVITVAFTEYNDEMKVIIEKLSDTALPTRASDNEWTEMAGVTTTISQLGLFYEYGGKSDYFNGMSYVIRLKDGSFIVIDGGHGRPIDGERLYNVMKKQAPDPNKIVIAAWFFTHGHSDHTGFFKSFCQNYASKVKVEQFVYNFPSSSEIDDADESSADASVEKYFKNVPVVKAHPGQVFHLRNAKVTMLYTNDLWVYGQQALETANEASLVFSVELEGKKFMVLGDYYDDVGILRSLYSASTLKSDIMQVSHHGISNCGAFLYPIIAPEWVLWPLGSDYIEEYDRVISEHKINAYMKTMDKDKVFMAKDDIVILTLNNGNITAEVFETDAEYLAQ